MRIYYVLLLLGFASIVHAAEPLNFNRDIRPILSSKCFSCHGPDGQDRDADYRLDTKEGAFADLGGYAAIVPGNPDESELIYRITTDDASELMPPPKHKNPLTEEEKKLLNRWIEEGAAFAGHWAYEPIARPELPQVEAGSEHAIDHFIGATLHKEQLAFSPEASPETLIRRLHLDLTGLPPTPEEVAAFTADPEGSYESTIDRLMASPHFAERLALEWLDVARFADTNGYSIDDHRDMWAWRDWVIHAFQSGMPYDEFIRLQIAGDLLPDASDYQRMATGFLRNSMNTHEGGTIAEEYRVAYVADKIDVVSTAFMGLTMKCAQCHDHKYDPLSMRDYYRFFAFFNTSTEPGKGAVNGNTAPFMQVAPLLQTADEFRQVSLDRIATLEQRMAYPEPLLGDAQSRWEADVLAKRGAQAVKKSVAEHFPNPSKHDIRDLSWIWSDVSGKGLQAWFRKRFDLDRLPTRAQILVSCDNEAVIYLNGKKIGENPDWRSPTILDLTPHLKTGGNQLAIVGKDWDETGQGQGVAALLALIAISDGTFIASDKTWKVAKKELPGWQNLGGDPKGFEAAQVVKKHGSAPWGNVLSRVELGEPAYIQALSKARSDRSVEEQYAVAAAFAKANGDMKKLYDSLKGEIKVQRRSLRSGKTSVMVMDESSQPRDTPILDRGAYDQPGEIVTAALPEVFDTGSSDQRLTRLDLAEWLVDPSNPLTARVTVNRYWQMLFGTGIVKTTEDFGSQGEWPSHPELLDWLASDFIASGWDVRHLLKRMLLSRTYRQSSDVSSDLLDRDPYNRLLARAPRYRLPAESVRDNALVIAGLMDDTLGGPSVYPPQPKGLWKEVSHFGHPSFFTSQHFYADQGAPVYRRSMYTFWKRTSPPPVMTAFDAPNRETCAVRRSLTNTPLQALALMNEPQFVEASKALAQRMLDHSSEFSEQLAFGFQLATARDLSAEEYAVFEKAYQRQLAYFKEAPDRVDEFLAGHAQPSAELAAMSSLTSLILNLDETITRE